jgi:hypothetical protein
LEDANDDKVLDRDAVRRKKIEDMLVPLSERADACKMIATGGIRETMRARK